jgi:hypothetical protein
MAGPTRLELATSGVTGRRSNQLNYDPAMGWPIIENCPLSFKEIPGFSQNLRHSVTLGIGGYIMAKLTKKDEFLERLGIEMDHVKAGLMELKAKGRKFKLEARLEYEKGLRSLEERERDLKVRMGEWSKAGQKAGEDVKKGLEQAAKDLKKAVDDAYARLK